MHRRISFSIDAYISVKLENVYAACVLTRYLVSLNMDMQERPFLQVITL